MSEQKHIVWFSCGAASAVMARIVSKQIPECHIVYCEIDDEHEDNKRFLKDCEKWIGKEIEIIRSEEYKNVADVIEKTHWIRNFMGARCTLELKRNVRLAYSTHFDFNYWGFTLEEKKRFTNFEQRNSLLKSFAPLIREGISKGMCLAIINEAGIDIPEMYKLGYSHNNCKGCLKSSSPKYWNMIRRDFPEVFKSRAEQSRKLNFRMVRLHGKDIFLDELPDYEVEETDIDITCDLGCQMIYNEIIK